MRPIRNRGDRAAGTLVALADQRVGNFASPKTTGFLRPGSRPGWAHSARDVRRVGASVLGRKSQDGPATKVRGHLLDLLMSGD
jgi:hypothetical protein